MPRKLGQAAGIDVTAPTVPREGTARLPAAEENSHRFQPTTEAMVILACSRAAAHFVVAIAEAGTPVLLATVHA
jgi:hypothetical protein